jgi:hypothetical protein
MKPRVTNVLNIVLNFVPDPVVCWAAAKLTDSGWSGFWIMLVALQCIYIFFWLKNALWSWLLFWIYRKRALAAHLENSFIDSRLPTPDEHTTDLDDYFSGISNNEEIDPDIRVKVAHELGTINGLKIAGRYSMVFQLYLAGTLALKRYARLAKRFAQ